MRAALVILFSIICAVVVHGQTLDYCARRLCPVAGTFHVACTNRNVFAPTCSKDVKLVAPANYQKILLAEHNRLRNEVASGNLAGYEGAMRMATLVWDDELARLAQIWAKQCEQVKDTCRNVDRYTTVGQNMHTATRNSNYNITALLIEAVNTWYDENAAMTATNVAAHVYDVAYENFAQLILDKVTKIGCATVEYTFGTSKAVNTFCNYNSAPVVGEPLYVEGCATAQCLLGRNTEYTGLCPVKEDIRPNWNE